MEEGGFGDLAADGGGDVDGEEGEHYHSHDGEDGAGDFAGGGDGEDAAAGGGGGGTCPPEGVPEVLDLWVDALLAGKEDEGAEVDAGDEDGDVGEEDAGDAVARDVAYNHATGPNSPGKGDEADEVDGIGGELDVEGVDDVKIGDGEEEKYDVIPEVAQFVGVHSELDGEDEYEDYADDELEVHIGFVAEEVGLVEDAHGEPGD